MFDPLDPKCVLCLEDTCPSNDNTSHGTSFGDLIEFASYIECALISDERFTEGTMSISLCAECEYMIKAFCASLNSLRIAQIKVDSCLKQIQDKMLKAKSSEMEDSKNIELNNLRRNFIEKSSVRLKKSRSQPVVKLVNAHIDHATQEFNQEAFTIVKTEPVMQETESEDNANHDLEDASQMEMGVNVDNSVEEEVFQLSGSGTESKKRKKMHKPCQFCTKLMNASNIPGHEKICLKNPKLIQSNDLKGPKKYLSCPFCRAEFQMEKPKSRNAQHGSWMLRQHLMKYHGSHYFPTQKHESVTDLEYQKILVELLFEGLVDGKESCAFCTKTFLIPPKSCKKSGYHTRHKLHYVDAHYRNLEERLNDIQNDPNLREKLSKCNPKGRECEQCGIYLTCHIGWATHQKLHCNKTEKQAFFIPNKSAASSIEERLPVLKTEVTNRVKCKHCGTIVSHAWAKHHLKSYCKALNKQVAKVSK